MSINYLQPEDLAALRRFKATSDDGEGYDVSREIMHRLAELGVVCYHRHGIYSITWFGMYVLDQANNDLCPPFRTESDRIRELNNRLNILGF
ncbi:hypothetical protein PSI19_16200 [Xenorhabdus khoisanae]|uniref:Uncharacterized protein n=1 Tax=Xenorhabdus khoisanae TaxID=880157 RepID=A0A0J5FXK7_9GAMM|nr:hypothetical protein [Xenorhabdus khoisanae]KMJ46687.1 hypothetical protein AB204_02395 [Xenorhabdus khoisanae]MDC9615379.1 hypothetical protein [Xenorhabdus khoisanae]